MSFFLDLINFVWHLWCVCPLLAYLFADTYNRYLMRNTLPSPKTNTVFFRDHVLYLDRRIGNWISKRLKARVFLYSAHLFTWICDQPLYSFDFCLLQLKDGWLLTENVFRIDLTTELIEMLKDLCFQGEKNIYFQSSCALLNREITKQLWHDGGN